MTGNDDNPQRDARLRNTRIRDEPGTTADLTRPHGAAGVEPGTDDARIPAPGTATTPTRQRTRQHTRAAPGTFVNGAHRRARSGGTWDRLPQCGP